MRAGTQFLLPTEDAIVVAEELVRRWGLPKWQFALTSSQAVSDVIRLARAATGRERVVVFEGKYQGHVAELLAISAGETSLPEYDGITPADIARTIVVPWNDLEAVDRALADDVALLLAEPALTNSGIVLPADGFHEGLRRLTREKGTVLAIDETQTLPMAYGGLVREWGLEPDAVIVGKSFGGGIPVSAYGFDERLAATIDRDYQTYEVSGEAVDEPAIGGTMYGNALSHRRGESGARACVDGGHLRAHGQPCTATRRRLARLVPRALARLGRVPRRQSSRATASIPIRRARTRKPAHVTCQRSATCSACTSRIVGSGTSAGGEDLRYLLRRPSIR